MSEDLDKANFLILQYGRSVLVDDIHSAKVHKNDILEIIKKHEWIKVDEKELLDEWDGHTPEWELTILNLDTGEKFVRWGSYDCKNKRWLDHLEEPFKYDWYFEFKVLARKEKSIPYEGNDE